MQWPMAGNSLKPLLLAGLLQLGYAKNLQQEQGPGSSWAQCSVELEITSCSTWQHIDVLSRIDWPSAAPASVGKTTLASRPVHLFLQT
jgi:hypothetical protein